MHSNVELAKILFEMINHMIATKIIVEKFEYYEISQYLCSVIPKK
jgi:hypothetical protein